MLSCTMAYSAGWPSILQLATCLIDSIFGSYFSKPSLLISVPAGSRPDEGQSHQMKAASATAPTANLPPALELAAPGVAGSARSAAGGAVSTGLPSRAASKLFLKLARKPSCAAGRELLSIE